MINAPALSAGMKQAAAGGASIGQVLLSLFRGQARPGESLAMNVLTCAPPADLLL
jgi:hypothetical protein